MSIQKRIEKLEQQATSHQPASIILYLPSEVEGMVVRIQDGKETLLTSAEAEAQHPFARAIKPLEGMEES